MYAARSTTPPAVPDGAFVKIQIRRRKGAVTARLRAHVERRLTLSLATFGTQVKLVTVRFASGQTDDLEVCKIDVRLQPRVVRGEDTNIDAFAAVDHAARRVSRSLLRLLQEERRSS